MSLDDSKPTPPEWVTLEEGEEVWLRASPSTNLVLAALGAGFVFLVAMSVVVGFFLDIATGRAVSFGGLVLVVGMLGAAYGITRSREYLLTSDRICTISGVWRGQVDETAVADVRAVTVEQSAWQRLVNIGDLRFVTDTGTVEFSLVENPTSLHQQVRQLVDLDA